MLSRRLHQSTALNVVSQRLTAVLNPMGESAVIANNIFKNYKKYNNYARLYGSTVRIGGEQERLTQKEEHEEEEDMVEKVEEETFVPPEPKVFPPTPLSVAMQKKLEWRESVLEDGSILYRHPTVEEVLSVKMARMLVSRAVHKKWREAKRLEQEMRERSEHFIPRKTKQQEEADLRRIIEEVRGQMLNSTYVLSPEAIAEVRRLRMMDPLTYNTKNLSKIFQVKPELINMVSRDPEDKVKHDLRVLEEWNRNRPRKGTRQPLNR